jgi:hypothetical protein
MLGEATNFALMRPASVVPRLRVPFSCGTQIGMGQSALQLTLCPGRMEAVPSQGWLTNDTFKRTFHLVNGVEEDKERRYSAVLALDGKLRDNPC